MAWTDKQKRVNEKINLREKLGKDFIADEDLFHLNYIEDEKDRKILAAYCRIRRRGQIKKLLERFDIDQNYLQRLRQKHGIKSYEKYGPKRKAMIQKIKDFYLKQEYSTEYIAKECLKGSMSGHQVAILLKNEGVQLRTSGACNLKYFKTSSEFDPKKLLKEIVFRYVEQDMTISEISKDLNIMESTISRKLQAAGYEIKRKRGNSKEKYQCRWCGHEDFSWTTGKRAQRYCGGSCKNKAKDLRRGKRTPEGLRKLKNELALNWGQEYPKQLERIMNNE